MQDDSTSTRGPADGEATPAGDMPDDTMTHDATTQHTVSDAGDAAGSVDALFDHGLLGFPQSRRFSLAPWGAEDGPFSLMRSLDDPAEFLVADPYAFFPDYEPEIDSETAEWLGVTEPDDAVVLVIVSVPDEAENATANLLGPLLINKATRRSIQMVLNDPWGTRHPLFNS